MPNFEDFRQKAKEVLGVAVNVTKEAAGTAAKKTKALAKVARLNAEIDKEKKTVIKTYMEMGRLYYEKYKDSPDTELAQACDEVSLVRNRIEAKRLEIELLKAEAEEEDEIEVEIIEAAEEEIAEEEIVEASIEEEVEETEGAE